MAGPLIADRVAQVTTGTGTGTLSLEPTVATGLRSFVDGVGGGNTCFYCISSQGADEWEVGVGTVTDSSPDTLSRDTVLSSSNAGALVNFTAGTKDVFCVAPAGFGTPVRLAGTRVIENSQQEALSATAPTTARGTGSVDMQVKRSAGNQVTAGAYATISGGLDNRASNASSSVHGGRAGICAGNATVVAGGHTGSTLQNYCVALGGYGNVVSGSLRCVMFGGKSNSTTSGAETVVFGGTGHTLTTANSVVLGGASCTCTAGTNNAAMGNHAKASKRAEIAHAAGFFAADEDAQGAQYVLRNSTTNATPAVLFLNGSSERLTLTNDATFFFDILVVARRTDANDESAAYHFAGCIDRNASAAATALVGSVTKTVIAEDTAAWDCNVTADSTNGAISITVTGEAAKTIRWVAHVRTVETIG